MLHEDDTHDFRDTLASRTGFLSLALQTVHISLSESSGAKGEGHRKVSKSTSEAEQLQILRQLEGLLQAPSLSPHIGRHFRMLAPAFVQRLDIMHDIEELLLPIPKTRQTILVLQGMGGNGKPQMAKEYAAQL